MHQAAGSWAPARPALRRWPFRGASGQVCTTAAAETIADTIAVRNPVPEALEEMQATVDELIQVSEDELRAAVRLLHQELGLVVEPSAPPASPSLSSLHPASKTVSWQS